jgi:hypothetical protein
MIAKKRGNVKKSSPFKAKYTLRSKSKHANNDKVKRKSVRTDTATSLLFILLTDLNAIK